MQIHHYSKDTGEYIGSSEARPDPKREGRYLIPANATTVEPPAVGANEAVVFDGSTWALVPDYRGLKYWLDDGNEGVIDVLGIEPPEGALDAPPPIPIEELRLNAYRRIMAGMDDELSDIIIQYPRAERLTWDRQLYEANSIKTGTGEPTPLIDAMIVRNGRTKTQQADRIIARARKYMERTGDAVGRRQKYAEQIEAAYTAGDRATLESMDWA